MSSLTQTRKFKSLTRKDAERALANEIQRLLPTCVSSDKSVSVLASLAAAQFHTHVLS